jgi:hypothetical protein
MNTSKKSTSKKKYAKKCTQCRPRISAYTGGYFQPDPLDVSFNSNVSVLPILPNMQKDNLLEHAKRLTFFAYTTQIVSPSV